MPYAREVCRLNLAISYPWVLSLLVSCIIPLLVGYAPVMRFSSLTLIPDDNISTLVGIFLRIARSLTLALLTLGLRHIPDSRNSGT